MSDSERKQSTESATVTTRAVRTALDSVLDPELDRSIVELEYIDEISIEAVDTGATTVTVAFTLPTAWCSPGFAWMMASDARSVVESLSGVDTAEIVLQDHMHEKQINTGVNEGRPFEAVFPDADGGLAAVRATLDHKARLARQYDAVETLVEAGLSPAQIVSLTPSDLEQSEDDDRLHIFLAESAFAVSVDAQPIEAYLDKAAADDCLTGADEPLFRTPEGEPIEESTFELLRHRTRSAKVNVDGQGTVCDALNESRRDALGRTGD
jgi:metal-sulfur cluster biosynthetic enzyme